jgi:Ca2+-transporting ATPase
MTSFVTVAHSVVPNRTRYRVEGLYRNRRLRGAIEQGFSTFVGVSVSASELTGTVLVVTSNGHGRRALVARLETIVRDYRRRPRPSARHSAVADRLRTIHARVSRWLQKRTGAGTTWHALERQRAVALLESTNHGLQANEAAARLQRYGPNLVRRAPPTSGRQLFLRQLQSLPVALLGAAACLALVTNAAADALVILAVVGVNAIVGYVTERRSERIIHAFTRFTTGTTLILRDSLMQRVDVTTVVPGDVLVLRRDAYVPADARLLEVNELTVDESALTGESAQVVKSVHPVAVGAALADRLNMVHRGTFITGGDGYAIVVATGANTEIGLLQQSVESLESGASPLQQQLDRLGRELTVAAVFVCGAVLATGLARGFPLLQMVRTALSLAVSAIPEGLPAVATTTMALAVGRLRQRGVVVRHLSAVETLGSVQTLCLDKTGTLTENRMTVVSAAVAHRSIVNLERTLARMRQRGSKLPASFGSLLRLAALSTDVRVARHSDRQFEGSPTEIALVEAAAQIGIDVECEWTRHPVAWVVHRSQAHNLMCTTHRLANGARRRVQLSIVKGNPTELLQRCTYYLDGTRKLPLSAVARHRILLTNERISAQSLRVLGVAYCHTAPTAPRTIPSGLTWVGLVGMADRIREGTRELIKTLHRAGVRTVMITGDQPGTAAAIARAIGLSGHEPLEIVEGTRLTVDDNGLLDDAIARAHVFARVSPAQKLQIVRALQRTGQIVGMTGDGVNDGPALKAANLGIVIGDSATDLAKEVASLVVPDGRPDCLAAALLEGRAVCRNIRRSVHFLAATNFSETVLVAAGIAIGHPEVLTPRQLLWINVVSDLWPSLALTLEAPSDDLMNEAPRAPHVGIVSRDDFSRLALEGAVLAGGAITAYGSTLAARPTAAPTTAFVGLTTSQLLQAWVMRGSFRSAPNIQLNLAVITSLLVQALALVWSPLRRLMGMAPLNVTELLRAIGCAVLPAAINSRLHHTPRLRAAPLELGSAARATTPENLQM